MAEIRMDDPEVYKRAKTDGQGRVYLGTDYAETEVQIAFEVERDE